MKAGILTFHYAHHYGAQLQAYALMKAIEGFGVDCEIINYVRPDTIDGNRLFKKKLSIRAIISNADTLINYRSLKKRYDRFNDFVRTDMKLSQKFYGSYQELADDPPAYDVYVCGSDQIWNPMIFKEKTYDPAFFAEFASGGRRVSYAPSFGISSIPEDRREQLAGYLEKFHRVSVREKQGEKIIRDISGKDAATVLDPTLLLTGEEWGRLAAPAEVNGPYLLCYFITDAGKYAEYVRAVSEKFKLPVISLCGSRRVVPQTIRRILDAGPREFLGLFAGASAVCTDSFHGTVFSLVFNREFYCFDSSNDTAKTVSSRLHNILDITGLTARLYPIVKGVGGFAGLIAGETGTIDYQYVRRIISEKRDESLSYLKEALCL